MLCIIPARGNSKRLPHKNTLPLAGKPLLAYTIEAALESSIFDSICVSSEDEEILSMARSYGVKGLERPQILSTDNAQVKHVVKYVLEYYGLHYSEFTVLLPTSPLRTALDITKAYELFKSKDANYLMSLVPYSHPPQQAVWIQDKYIKPYFGLQYMIQSQLLDTLYNHDGSIIMAKSAIFLKEGEFYGSKVIPYFIPIERSVDINNQLDLAWAEFLLQRKEKEL